MTTNSYSLIDASEGQLFLFLENDTGGVGNVYISDAEGRSFSFSLENVVKGNAVDFERIASLDGTFLANVNSTVKPKKGWSETDLVSQENRKASHSRLSNQSNDK